MLRFAAAAALLLSACAPTLKANESFLTAEELKVTPAGDASLKSTGESMNLAPIAAEESRADKVEITKVHGTYVLVAEGYKHAYRLWEGGTDELHYKPLKLDPGPSGFRQPELEMSGNCAVIKWQRGGVPAQAFVNADGDVDEKNCPK